MIGHPGAQRGRHEAAAAEALELVALGVRLADALEALGPDADQLAAARASARRPRCRPAWRRPCGPCVLTTGIRKTRSAPSGRRNRPVVVVDRDHRHQAVDRDRAGVVGDHQRAAVGGDVLDAADLDPEPLLRDRAQRGHEEPLGDLLVEAVLVDDVVAGHAGGAGRPGSGRAAAPTGRRRPRAAACWKAASQSPDRDAASAGRGSRVAAARARR